MAEGATTPMERLGPACRPVPDAAAAPVVQARLELWRRTASGGDPDAFARRLSWDGLDDAAARRALGPVRLLDAARLPEWAERWGHWTARAYGHLDAHPEGPLTRDAASADLPFQDLLAPLATCALEAFRQRPEVLAALDAGFLAEAALPGLGRSLLEGLAQAAAPAFQRHFQAFRRPWVSDLDLALTGLAGPPGTAVYRAYTRELLEAGGIFGFFETHCVLARLLEALGRNWAEACGTCVARLAAHRDLLVDRFFPEADPGPVTRIRMGAGDRHNGGRTTAILTFRNGARLVYKPVPSGIDTAWHGLLEGLREQGAPCLPGRHAHLEQPGHGWSAFVADRPCGPGKARRRFQARCGALLGLIHVLGGGDCHAENLLIDGEFPVWVDLETLMTPFLLDLEHLGEPAPDPHQELLALACGTGFLPRWVGLGRRAVDTSPFAPAAAGPRVLAWRHPNTDGMTRALAPGPDLPAPWARLAADEQPDLQVQEDLVAGFRLMLRFLRTHRSAWASGASGSAPFRAFQARTVRVILRGTHVYARILDTAAAGGHLGDGADFFLHLEHLAFPFRRSRIRPALWAAVAAERNALAQGDIPYFTLATDGRDLRDGTGGLVCPGAVAQRPVDRLQARLSAMNAADPGLMADVIRTAFQLRTRAEPSACAWKVELPGAGQAPDDAAFLAEASALGREVHRQAFPSEGGLGWHGLAFVRDGDWREAVVPAGLDLYTGNAGIGFFLACLARATGSPADRALALAAFAPVLRGLEGPEGLLSRLPVPMGLQGVGGVLYALVQAALQLGEDALLQAALRGAATLSPGRLAQDPAHDLMAGRAGTLLGLLAVWRATGSGTVLDQAVGCGRRLLRDRKAGPEGSRAWPGTGDRMPGGFAHGAAGIAHALVALGAATGEEAFEQAAVEAIRYENTLFDRRLGAWQDLREQVNGQEPFASWGWCNGGAGIALGRVGCLAGLEGLDRPGRDPRRWRADLEAGLPGAGPQPALNASLCCGHAGRADILLEAGQRLSRPDWIQAGRQVAAALLKARRETDPRERARRESPFARLSLFRGLTGLGYLFLRAARPGRVPCVLGLAPAAGPPAP